MRENNYSKMTFNFRNYTSTFKEIGIIIET